MSARPGPRRRRNPLRAVVRKAREESAAEAGEGNGVDSLRRRGVFLLPNLITTGALFAGFYAVVAAMNGDYLLAALAIFTAMVLDAADGRVARLTRTESLFGAQYDSLSDMVAFGVAPALLAFSWALVNLGQLGWVVTFIFMACAALRLARYNTQGETNTFTGLASPSAAAIVAALVWTLNEYRVAEAPAGMGSTLLLATVVVVVALLMVSNFGYLSFKGLMFKGRVPFVTLVAVVLAFALILVDPPRVLLTIFVVYALSGPAQYLWQARGTPGGPLRKLFRGAFGRHPAAPAPAARQSDSPESASQEVQGGSAGADVAPAADAAHGGRQTSEGERHR